MTDEQITELADEHTFDFDEGVVQFARALLSASKPAVELDDDLNNRIRQIFLANGFTIKEGQTDLKPYVYQAAYALLWATGVIGAASPQSDKP